MCPVSPRHINVMYFPLLISIGRCENFYIDFWSTSPRLNIYVTYILGPFTNCVQTLTYHAPTCFIISSDMLSVRNLVPWTTLSECPHCIKCYDIKRPLNLFAHIMLPSTQIVILDSRLLRRSGPPWTSLSQRQTGLNLMIHINPRIYSLGTALFN